MRIIVVVGPTASGKSDLAIRLAKKYNGEIISADSRQVYRGMDIGTGKVTKKEQKLVRHHLIDVADPRKDFNVDDFKKLAQKNLANIISRGKLPIIVGGTGHYVDTLVYNLKFPSVPPDKRLRRKLDKKSAEELFAELQKLDPERAETIEPKNKRRLIRALEIIKHLGKVPKLEKRKYRYNAFWIGIKLSKEELEKRIIKRVEKRLKDGALEEVKELIAKGVSKKRIYNFGLGYRAMIRFVNKEIGRKEMTQEFIRSEIQYSKRQMTWFKRNKDINWIPDVKKLPPIRWRESG